MKKKTLQVLFILLAVEVFGANVATAQYKTDSKSKSSSSSGSSSSSSSNSGDNKKFFFAIGISPFLNYYNGPTGNTTITSYTGTNGAAQQVPVSSNFSSYEYVSVLLRFRLNIAEFSANQSLSISAIPTIGLGLSSSSTSYNYDGATGFGSIAIPVILEYNGGNIATFRSDKDKGVVLGLGIEYVKAPLTVATGDFALSDATYAPPSTWVEPVFEIGYRYWNKRNKAKEFNLQVGYGGKTYSVCLSWNKYIGY